MYNIFGGHIKGILVSNLNANFGHSQGRENRQRLQFNQVGTIFANLLQTLKEQQASDAEFEQKDDKMITSIIMFSSKNVSWPDF